MDEFIPPLDFINGVSFVCDYAESPIEQSFGIALVTLLQHLKPLFCLGSQQDSENIVLIPQYKWQSYRIDFAVCYRGRRVFVECDGHDFHERTKAQAEHDRSRDRIIQAAGIGILRFTGREINRDEYKCAWEVIEFCRNVFRRG